ncbi:MAG TPA: mevalonate kinase [Candidatus Poseidoniaceae archaeon]|nr:mevalonate kinase [Candidatus Poseidoniaceae archaeon]
MTENKGYEARGVGKDTGDCMGRVSTSAPGKCILFGEHAVVYGQPAVAVAIGQRISVSIETLKGNSETWKIDGMEFDPKRHPHVQALRNRLWQPKQGAPNLSIRVIGDIPPASGLGSSAALSVAASAALRVARGRWYNSAELRDSMAWSEGYSSQFEQEGVYSIENCELNAHRDGDAGKSVHYVSDESVVDLDECALLAHAVEAIAQGGRASPMDASTCAHGGIVLLSDTLESEEDFLYSRRLKIPEGEIEWHLHSINLPKSAEEVYLVIGNTGIHAPTSKQVAKVAAAMKNNPQRMKEIETIGVIARRGIKSLKEGDFAAVGRAMTENQIMLQGLGVSCPELENLIRAAAPTSLGAKLTGAGGGGCMVALTTNPKQTSEAIELAGGRTLISRFGNAGLSVDECEDLPLWATEPIA